MASHGPRGGYAWPVDDLAQDHEVILVDSSGVDRSTGETPGSVEGFARDVFLAGTVDPRPTLTK